jgi:hypothetical protein
VNSLWNLPSEPGRDTTKNRSGDDRLEVAIAIDSPFRHHDTTCVDRIPQQCPKRLRADRHARFRAQAGRDDQPQRLRDRFAVIDRIECQPD